MSTNRFQNGVRFVIPLILCAVLALIAGCTNEVSTNTDTSATTTAAATTTGPTDSAAAAAASGMATFNPVPMPDPHITGYMFPEPEPTIIGWTNTNNQKAINLHAWGIWTALTQETNEVFAGQKLRVFETWPDVDDLISTPPATGMTALAQKPRLAHRLKKPRQFEHGGGAAALGLTANGGESTVLAFVKYDPTGGDHIVKNNLFSSTNLSAMLTAGKQAIPDFPNPSLALKPVFQTLSGSTVGGGRYYQLSTWPGSPQLTYNSSDKLYHSIPFPQKLWKQCVWIDVQAKGKGTGTGGVDTTCTADGSSRTPANTYGVDDFIRFQLTAAEAAAENAQGQSPPAKAGDYAVLVAMHVTSREITRWTWETFWWVPNPDKPTAPSSPAIAADRPPQLQGAPRNYAHCTAYDMENPATPLIGGNNNGDSIYCFNPYLEAPFTPSVLPKSIPGYTMFQGKKVQTANNVGAQTNCMSCHGQANWPVVNPAPYTGDQYIAMNAPQFKGVLKTDFLWSIPDNACPQPGQPCP
ncbi:MAG: hypothetical protein QOK37_166 [Thermoanaerobaculia bacterium]|jgi:hypothetical protein|nr:hypothetical protein [Thermoanaerobaculia bacterium]